MKRKVIESREIDRTEVGGYKLKHACPGCKDNLGINRIKMRAGWEGCRVCGKEFRVSERLDVRLKHETDW